MDSEPRKIIAVVGPTASGKTRRAVELAQAFNGEIISADSRQVYRKMDIGTGKDLQDYGNVPYHLIDICEPGEKYNLFRYLDDYNKALDHIELKGKKAIVCGGSGMYVENALNGLSMPKVDTNPTLREELKHKSLEELTTILASMKTLHNITDVDTVSRAIRAIEIQTYYEQHPEQRPVTTGLRKRNAVIIGIDIPREKRRERITQRLIKRLDQGLIDEVKLLLKSGVQTETLIYYGLEYKWVTLYLTDKISHDEMYTKLLTAIHQFAKRQMTWFRGMERRGFQINWVPFDIDTNELVKLTDKWLSA